MKEELKDIYTILKRNNNNITFTLEEFTEYVLKHTKFKFLYNLQSKTNKDIEPHIKIDLNGKLNSIAIYNTIGDTVKTCKACQETLPISEFNLSSYGTLNSECIKCKYLLVK